MSNNSLDTAAEELYQILWNTRWVNAETSQTLAFIPRACSTIILRVDMWTCLCHIFPFVNGKAWKRLLCR